MNIAVFGGTGNQGSGLVMRWALAGHQVIIGSRSLAKAQTVSAGLVERLGGGVSIAGMENAAAAAACQVAVLSVPFHCQLSILEDVREGIKNKTLITVVVPLKQPAVDRVWRPGAGSAAREAQNFLGEGTPVVNAFQNVGAFTLQDPHRPIDADILVCSDFETSKQIAMQLVVDAGLRPVDAGPLDNASVVEGLTAI
ncbi:MAG: NADPH-dependent F420 reductase [Anaerolineales bacterium]|nr:NADPH-dependent F420 reductase [Anaerolineales bacterium]